MEKRLLLGLRIYIEAHTCGKFLQTLILPWVKDVSHVNNYDYFTLFIHNLITFLVW